MLTPFSGLALRIDDDTFFGPYLRIVLLRAEFDKLFGYLLRNDFDMFLGFWVVFVYVCVFC